MDLGLQGKRAIVCGSSRGLGRACAFALAEAGVEVLLNGRSERSLEAVQLEFQERFHRPFPAIVADVTTSEGRATLLEAMPEADILVNNAAGPAPGRFEDWGEQAWMDAIQSSMMAPIHLTTAVVGAMRARGWGRIINITSSSVKEPLPMLGLSTAARLGLTGFVATLAREVAGDGVTLNNLLPGRFDTDRLTAYVGAVAEAGNLSHADARAAMLREIPAKRLGRVDEFGALCAFLASQWAGYITGQNITLDGGSHQGVF